MAAVAVVAFAGASFFFALAETALFSLGKWQVGPLAQRHPKSGALVQHLLTQPQDLLATMVFGNTFAFAGMVGVALWVALSGHWPLVLTVAVMLVLVLLGCEVLPKTLAVRQPERWSLRVARPMMVLQILTRPLHLIAQKLNLAILKVVAAESAKPRSTLSDEEYRELLDLAFQQGTLAKAERDIILQIISLDRRTVKEVMKPRAQMAAVSDDASVGEMVETARKFKHRRLPIYDETLDTIVGVLNTRALLLNPQADLAEAIEFPSFVPETMNQWQLLKSLQRQQRGLAIVLDEFGGTAGIVTMEDILGELVGRIRGENEVEGFVMEKLGPGRWRVNATTRIEDFRREYPALGDVPEVETIGGLLISLRDAVPAQGDSATFRGLKLTTLAADERRVREVLVETQK